MQTFYVRKNIKKYRRFVKIEYNYLLKECHVYIYIYIYMYIYIKYWIIWCMKITGWKSKAEYWDFHRTGFTDVHFQVCEKDVTYLIFNSTHLKNNISKTDCV